MIGPAVVDAHDDGFLVGEIGDARIARDRQRRMRGRDRRHVVDLAVGGRPAVEILAVPGRQALGAVIGIFLRLVGPAADGVGLADAIGAAALGHRLAERDQARARRHAVFRIELARGLAALGEQDSSRRPRPRDQAQPPPPPRPIGPQHATKAGAPPLNRIQPLTIPRLEKGRNGVGAHMVNI